VIVDVQATRAIRQAEVGAAKTMIGRTEEPHPPFGFFKLRFDPSRKFEVWRKSRYFRGVTQESKS